MVFMDGHVGAVGLKELWLLKWHRLWPENVTLPEWPQWMQKFKDPR